MLIQRQTLADHFVAGFMVQNVDILTIFWGVAGDHCNDKFTLPGVLLTNKTSIYERNPDPFGTRAGFFDLVF